MFAPSMIPSDANFDVQDSSFFRTHGQLPSPQTVRSEARAQHLAGIKTDKRRRYSLNGLNYRPPPVVFETMGLFVKWGRGVRVAEGQALYSVRHYLKNEVPVPEIYGWRTDGEDVFLYIKAITGPTLEQSWDKMTTDDRLGVCRELWTAFDSLRRLKQDPLEHFVGSAARGLLYDRSISIRYLSEAGPFTSVKEFHDWFTFLYRRPMPDPHSVPIEHYRQELPDDIDIKFTHGDLHRSNILLTISNPPKVAAIVDWEQAGWLPAYWEDRKAHLTAEYK